jgi:hypothetical protein
MYVHNFTANITNLLLSCVSQPGMQSDVLNFIVFIAFKISIVAMQERERERERVVRK